MACLTGCSRADRNVFRDHTGVCRCWCVCMYLRMCVCAFVNVCGRKRKICHFFISMVWLVLAQDVMRLLHYTPWQTYTHTNTHLSFALFLLPLSITIPASLFNYLQHARSSTSVYRSPLLFLQLDIHSHHSICPSPNSTTVYVFITISGS